MADPLRGRNVDWLRRWRVHPFLAYEANRRDVAATTGEESQVIGELRLARPAIGWCLVGAIPAASIAFLVRGSHGAVSALIAIAIVLANAAIAAGLSAAAGRISFAAAGLVSFPSFLLRLVAITVAFNVLGRYPMIDTSTLVVTFGIALVAVLALEARAWKRTPWLALTFKEESS
jgi:hypothetical protein